MELAYFKRTDEKDIPAFGVWWKTCIKAAPMWLLGKFDFL